MAHHRVVTRDEWLSARTQLLAREKEFTRLRDQLSQERRDCRGNASTRHICLRAQQAR
jgi:predicted dithiol-disulfide oxidoreductase (DUF899 family)